MNRVPTTSLRPRAFAAVALAAIALAGCAGQAPGPAASSAADPQGNWRGREEVRDAIALLNQGNAVEARQRLMRVLRRQEDGVARLLLSQIDGNPQQMLGAPHYPYTLRQGETLSTVAQRALGNPMLFYILARYNAILVPASVRPGQVILVPGREPAAQPQPRRTERPSAPRPAAPPASAPARPAPPAARPAARAPNPGLAGRLRAQGLAALNGGAVARAVALLRQALAADPANAAIRADLSRALRVQNTVRARP